MKRPQLVSQGSITRIMQAANQAMQQRHFQEATELFERANRLDPANPGVLLQLGNVHARRYDYAAAEACFEKAVRLAARKVDALTAAAQFCCDISNYAMAEGYLQRAVAQTEVTPASLVKLGEVYERLRRLPEAAQLAERALQRDKSFSPALLLQAQLDRQTHRLEQAENQLRRLVSQPDPFTCVRAWYELGGVLDRQKRYDEAMAAYQEAKTLLRPHAAGPAAERERTRGRLKAIEAGLTADMLQRWSDVGPALEPPRQLALLGGHPRSGTTLLEQVLDIHPDIVSAEETPIFYDDVCAPLTRGVRESTSTLSVLDSATPETLRAARARYFQTTERFLAQPVGSRLLLDKNPSLTFFIPVLIRVFPEIKLLVVLRDPRDVVLSCFMLPMLPLNQTACAFLSLESAVAEYVALMGIWQTLKSLIKNPWMEARYEDMVEDLASVARKTLDFLDVSWNPDVLKFDEHARQKMVRSPTYADVSQPVYKHARGRWRNYRKYLEPLLPALEPFVKAFGYE